MTNKQEKKEIFESIVNQSNMPKKNKELATSIFEHCLAAMKQTKELLAINPYEDKKACLEDIYADLDNCVSELAIYCNRTDVFAHIGKNGKITYSFEAAPIENQLDKLTDEELLPF